MGMRNSLSLAPEEVAQLEADGHPYTVRFKMPEAARDVLVQDEIRGEIALHPRARRQGPHETDGLPTYHLANVVDDHHMRISHVIRGESGCRVPVARPALRGVWLGRPKFAHLPLILKPTGNGKLSKRDGDKGFPIFPLEWNDPATGNTSIGYREQGYLPEAFLNIFLLLGWSSRDDEELYTLGEAIAAFDLQRVVKAGARFNPDKTLRFNEQYLRQSDTSRWIDPLKAAAEGKMDGWSGDQCQRCWTCSSSACSSCTKSGDRLPLRRPMPTMRNWSKKWKPETAGYLNDLTEVFAASRHSTRPRWSVNSRRFWRPGNLASVLCCCRSGWC